MLDRKMYWVLWCFGKFTTKQNTNLILHDFNAVEMIFFIMTVYIFSKRTKVCKELLTKEEKYFLKEKRKLLF